MQIMKKVEKIPGGLMVGPLFLAALINTFVPEVLEIGGFTTATFSSAAVGTAIGIQLVCIGSSIRVKEAPEILKRSLVLIISKFLGGFIIAMLVSHFFGRAGLFGLTPLVILGSMSNSNGSLYFGLVSEYGDELDQGAMGLLAINDGPFLTMLGMGMGGLADIPIMALVATIIPLLIGLILGNLDKNISEFLKPAGSILIPFVGFALGASINFIDIVNGGLMGIVLGVSTVIVTGAICIFADRKILNRPGYAGAAVATSAGNSVATPAAIAIVDPSWQPYVAEATAMAAASVVVTAILVPILTSYIAQKYGTAENSAASEELRSTTA